MRHFTLVFLLASGIVQGAWAQEGERIAISPSTIHDVIIEAHRQGGIDVQVYIPDQDIYKQQLAADAEYAEDQAKMEKTYQERRETAAYWRNKSQEKQGWFELENSEPYKRRWAESAEEIEYSATKQWLDNDGFATRRYDRNRPMVHPDEIGDLKTISIPANPTRAEKLLRNLMVKGGSFIRGGLLAGILAATAGATLVPEESMPRGAFQNGEIQAIETQIDTATTASQD